MLICISSKITCHARYNAFIKIFWLEHNGSVVVGDTCWTREEVKDTLITKKRRGVESGGWGEKERRNGNG